MRPIPPEGGNYTPAPVASAFRRNVLAAFLVLACAVYLVALGNSGIWDANEAFYVETPREMLEANDLVNPTFNYLPRFNKPVLSYWIVAAFYQIFGVSVAVQRFAIALGALIIIWCAYLLASISEPASPTPRSGEDAAPAESGKLEAGSGKREAGSGKREAGSGKLEAGSGKREAGSRKQEAGSGTPNAGPPDAGSRKREAE